MKKLLPFVPVLLWCALIFAFSHQPKDESVKYSQIALAILRFLHIDLNDWTMGNATFAIRKIAHITEYFILYLLTFFALSKISLTSNKKLIYSFLFCLFYACTDEFHQTFIPGRVGTISDVGVDSVGMGLGLLVGILSDRRSKRFQT